MKKLKSIIEGAIEGNKRKIKSLYDIQEAVRVYNLIVKSKEATTINGNTNDLCISCGLTSRPEGIGFKIIKYQ